MLCPKVTHAQSGVPAWTNLYNGPATNDDRAFGVAVDANNSVYVVGSSRNGSSSTGDYATIKYSSAGMPLWTNFYDGPGNSFDTANAVAVGTSNNVYVTGGSYGGAGGSTVDFATIKYSSAGVPLWTNRYNGPGNGSDSGAALAVDTNDDVYVTGSAANGGTLDFATIKYSSAGMPLWTNLYGGPGGANDNPVAVKLDKSNNVYVAGVSAGLGTGNDYATVKYSSAGVPLWTNRFNGAANSTDQLTGAAVDGSGNVFVTGYSYSGVSYDYVTIKYSSAGVPLWTNYFDGPANNTDLAKALTLDANTNVYVTGRSAGASGFGDYATIKYSSAGVPLWTNRFSGSGNFDDDPSALAVDGDNNVFVTGGSPVSGSVSDYATIAYSNAGAPLWTNRYHGPGISTDKSTAIATDNNNNVYVTGNASTTTLGVNDIATIKYAALSGGAGPSPIPLNYFVGGNKIVLTWANGAFNLQSAPLGTGAYTNIPGATSPYTNTFLDPQNYFRLKAN